MWGHFRDASLRRFIDCFTTVKAGLPSRCQPWCHVKIRYLAWEMSALTLPAGAEDHFGIIAGEGLMLS